MIVALLAWAVLASVSHGWQYEFNNFTATSESAFMYSQSFCDTPQDMYGWQQKTVCDSEPQFLSGFCQWGKGITQKDNNDEVFSLLLNKEPCAYVSNDKCKSRDIFSAQLLSPNLFGFGTWNSSLKVAPGQAIRTSLTVYGSGTQFGITFEGSKPKQLDLGVKNQYKTVELPFDATQGYHSYAWVWLPASIEFFVDGSSVWKVTTEIPSAAAPMIVNIYPCGASYCPKYTGTVNVQSNIKWISFQPQGKSTPNCSPKQWKQTWVENFDGNRLSKYWTAFNNCTHGPTTVEKELYITEAVIVNDGKVTLKATLQNATGPKGTKYHITSGWIDTSTDFSYCHGPNPNGFSQLYGRFDVNAQLPKGEYWPAIWFMNNDKKCWPTGGEIDLMEPALWSGDPPYSFRSTYHWGPTCNNNHAESTLWPVCKDAKNCTFADDFHTWTLIWNPNSIQWWLDGMWLGSVTQTSTKGALPNDPHYLILNNAVNGKQKGPSEGLPGLFEIDYIKAFQYSHF